MFAYKSIVDHKIKWFNLNLVVFVEYDIHFTKYLKVNLSTGDNIILANDWLDRDDVARFIKAMEGMEKSI